MAKTKRPSAKPAAIFVRPARKTHQGQFVAGVPREGIELPADEAAALLESGAVRRAPRPKSSSPAAPAKTEE